MTGKKKNGFFKRIFGGGNSSCCAVKFKNLDDNQDEIRDEIRDEPKEEQTSLTNENKKTRMPGGAPPAKPGCGC
ncbi:MAG: hypothetical protein MI802_21450 [Desulfobacterales bacterium]|nr:hypothetical protein [Desulfobacterales bacterium]